MNSPESTGPARKPRRYQLVAERVGAQSERIRRFRLARTEALPPLKQFEPLLDTRSNRKA